MYTHSHVSSLPLLHAIYIFMYIARNTVLTLLLQPFQFYGNTQPEPVLLHRSPDMCHDLNREDDYCLKFIEIKPIVLNSIYFRDNR